MSVRRSEAEPSAAGPGTGSDVPDAEPARPAPLPEAPGLVMLGTSEDAPICSDGTCR